MLRHASRRAISAAPAARLCRCRAAAAPLAARWPSATPPAHAALSLSTPRRWLSSSAPAAPADHFAQFSLDPAFSIDPLALKKLYQVHPHRKLDPQGFVSEFCLWLQDLQRGFHPDTRRYTRNSHRVMIGRVVAERLRVLSVSANGITAPHDVTAAQEESARINDSYAILLSPLRRAEHLLELHGTPISEADGVPDNNLLMEVME